MKPVFWKNIHKAVSQCSTGLLSCLENAYPEETSIYKKKKKASELTEKGLL